MFKDYFSIDSNDYQAYRPDYPEALFTYLADLCEKHQLAWDCATGTGQAAKVLAKYFDRVVATDASAAQIQHAAPQKNITYLCEPAETTSFADHSVDLITVAQALHWFDHKSFYQEVKRVLQPHGILAAWCYGNIQTEHQEIDALVKDLYWKLIRKFWAKERDDVDSQYENIPFPFKRLLVPQFQIEKNWNCNQLLGYISTWSGLRNFINASAENSKKVEEVFLQIENLWPKNNAIIDFNWPIHLLVTKLEN